MNYIATIIVTLATMFLGAFGLYNYVPLDYLEGAQKERLFSSTVTTINGSDTLSASRSTINTNFSNLNTDKLQSGDTAATLTITTLTAPTVNTNGITQSTSATSTFVGGISALRYYSTATSTFTNGLDIRGGCLLFNDVCITSTLVSSVSNNDSTLTISPTTGDVVASLNLANGNIWTVASTTFINGVTFGRSTTTSATTTNFYATLASTTDIYIGGTQTGGSMSYTSSSTAYACSTGTCTYTGSIPTNANWGMGDYAITDAGLTGNYGGSVVIARTGKTTAVVSIAPLSGVGNADGTYTLTWSGADLSINEDTDENTDSSVSGTVYWYK